MNLSNEELATWNIVKNRRRQMMYWIPNTLTGYHVNEKNVRIINLYQNRLIMLAMIFILLFSIAKVSLVILLPAFAVVAVGVELFFRKWYLPRLPILKVRDEDLEIFKQTSVLKSKSSSRFMEALVGAIMTLLFALTLGERPELRNDTLEFGAVILCIILTAIYAFYALYRYYSARRLYKQSLSAEAK